MKQIRDLPFRHNAKPGLGFEIFRLRELFERARRDALGHALDAPQRPDFHTIYLGLRGAGSLVVDFTPARIGAGLATIVARGRVQQFGPERHADAWMLLVSPDFLATDPRTVDPLRGARVLAPGWTPPVLALTASDRRELLALADQLVAEQARPLDALQPALLAALVRAVLLRLERIARAEADAAGTAPLAPELERFFTILERDCLRTRSVAHYARAAGVSARRLGELLVQHAGRSTKQVIDDRVVLEHKRMLAHTDVSVKELADRTGFDEPTNLVKFFRHHTGATPLEFRTSCTFLPSGRRS